MTLSGSIEGAQAGRRGSMAGWLLVVAQLILVSMLIAELRHIRRAPLPRCLLGVVVGAGGAAMMGMAAARLGRSLRPHPAPAAEAELRTDGLYRHIRHPMYTGLLVWAAGAALIGGSRRAFAALGALTAVLAVKAPYEEHQLARRFPDYSKYARHTPRFVPRFRLRRTLSSRRGEPRE